MADTLNINRRTGDKVLEQRLNTIDRKLEDIDTHMTEYKRHRAEEEERFIELLSVQERNSKAIADISQSIAGLLEIYQTGQALQRAGIWTGKFVKWLTGFAAIGVIISWFSDKI